MMVQYQAMRRELPDDVRLLFRPRDFYEIFFEDAQIASPILNVALTKPNGMPLCGVPHHAAEGCLAKLIRAGKRVALAEQTTEPPPNSLRPRAFGGKEADGMKKGFPEAVKVDPPPYTDHDLIS